MRKPLQEIIGAEIEVAAKKKLSIHKRRLRRLREKVAKAIDVGPPSAIPAHDKAICNRERRRVLTWVIKQIKEIEKR